MAQKIDKQLDLNRHNPTVICCGVLERLEIGWMALEDGTKCMPYLNGLSDENKYRINNCPSCGKYVRDVLIKIDS